MMNLFLSMYADDTVLLSDTAAGLQTMLNSLKDYTVKNKLLVNVDKTKILIFIKNRILVLSTLTIKEFIFHRNGKRGAEWGGPQSVIQ